MGGGTGQRLISRFWQSLLAPVSESTHTPHEEMEDVYEWIEIARDALRDATAALASAPLLNEPAVDEEEAV